MLFSGPPNWDGVPWRWWVIRPYYERMGFVPAARYGIYAAGDRQMYEPYLLVKELTPGVLDSVSGTIDL